LLAQRHFTSHFPLDGQRITPPGPERFGGQQVSREQASKGQSGKFFALVPHWTRAPIQKSGERNFATISRKADQQDGCRNAAALEHGGVVPDRRHAVRRDANLFSSTLHRCQQRRIQIDSRSSDRLAKIEFDIVLARQFDRTSITTRGRWHSAIIRSRRAGRHFENDTAAQANCKSFIALTSAPTEEHLIRVQVFIVRAHNGDFHAICIDRHFAPALPFVIPYTSMGREK
jgi:hypothetical protein